MSIIPDYATIALELRQQLEAQADITAASWSDPKRKAFYDQYVGEYIDRLNCYVLGGGAMRGMCITELTQFVAEKMDEFRSASLNDN